jgi:ubiquinone/menaquinone biosynthesis C-methylase UbiE
VQTIQTSHRIRADSIEPRVSIPPPHVFFDDRWTTAVRETMPDELVRIEFPSTSQASACLLAIKVGNRLSSHSLVPYAGPLFSTDSAIDRNDALVALESSIRDNFHHAQLDLLPYFVDIKPFTRRGWIAESRNTFISDLSVDCENAATPAVRRRARKAATAGVEFDPSVTAADFLEIWRATCNRRRLGEFLNPESLANLLDRIVAEGMGEILGSRLPDSRLVAANVILYDESSAYFWLSGFDPTEPHRGASNQLCHLQTLRRAAQRATRFDWLGANTPGVTEYKASFGPRLVSYFRVRSQYHLQENPVMPAASTPMTPAHHKISVQRSYERHVETFEEWTPSAAFQETFRLSVIAEIARRLSTAKSVRILEVGCGHGTWARQIYNAFPGDERRIEYVGIDFTEARIEAAKRRMNATPSATFLCMDCECFKPNQSFDLILAVEVISHVPFDRYPDWFARWRSWLADGGSAVVIDKDRFSKHNLRLKWDSLKRKLLPTFLAGRSYYFTEEFADLVSTLNYPSFARLSRVATKSGLSPRPILEHGMFRALTADRQALPLP